MPSIRELKLELDRLGMDYSDCREKSELVEKLAAASSGGPAASSEPASHGGDASAQQRAKPPAAVSDDEVQEHLSKINNLLDTLPASLALLTRSWSEVRSEKAKGQIKAVKALLDATAGSCSNEASWKSKLEEYNSLAKEYKRLRDMPRNMSGGS